MAIHPQVRVTVRPYGSVVPLGFFAFGIGMFLYAALDAPWVKPTEGHTIGLMLVTFVAPLEGTAAVIAFLARDTLAGVALGLFAGSWLLTGFATLTAKPGVLSPAQGYFLIAFSIAVLLLSVVAWLGQPLIAALLTVATVRGFLSAIYQLGGGQGWNHVAGWIAFAIFCIAMYGGLAFLLEDARGSAVFPLARRGSSLEAIEGDMETQLAGLSDEPGVRKHLQGNEPRMRYLEPPSPGPDPSPGPTEPAPIPPEPTPSPTPLPPDPNPPTI